VTNLDTRAQVLIAQQLASIRLGAIRRGLRVPPTSGFAWGIVQSPPRRSTQVDRLRARAEMSKLRRRFVQ